MVKTVSRTDENPQLHIPPTTQIFIATSTGISLALVAGIEVVWLAFVAQSL